MSSQVGLVGCENEALGAAIREQLIHAGLTCEPRHVVSLAQLVDRASLDLPHLIVVEQPASLIESTNLIRELAMVAPSHILALGPADDPRRIISMMQAGANEYIDIDQWQTMVVDAILRFRSRHHLSAERDTLARVIGVVCPFGGGGASTVAANVATVLSREHGGALLMDLRLEAGDLSAMLDLHPTFSWADLCANLGRLDESLFEQILTPHPSGVQLLAAPQNYTMVESVTTKGFRRALAIAKRKFPYVIFDLGGVHSAIQLEAATHADILAVVVRLDYPSIRNTRRCLDQLEALGIKRSKIRMIVNRYGQSKQLTKAQAQDALGCKFDLFLPDDVSSMNLAINSGKPVVSVKPWSRLSRRMVELANSLNGRHVE